MRVLINSQRCVAGTAFSNRRCYLHHIKCGVLRSGCTMRTGFLPMAAYCLFAAGCAAHPLQSDVTHLPLYEIIHKIRCEARDAEQSIMARRGLSVMKDG